MTGKQKILEAINAIDDKYQELLAGNKILIDSDELDKIGLRLEDQLNILDALKDDYECINYSYKRPYKKESDLEHEKIRHLSMLAAKQDIDASYYYGKAISLKEYEIEILDTFESIRNNARKDSLESFAYHSTVLSDANKIPKKKDSLDWSVVYVDLNNNQILVGLRPGAYVPLGKPLRFDSPPYNFMRYILRNADRPINIHEIKEKVEGCKTKDDLSELVRSCHFDKQLKRIFFERTTKKTIRFTPWRELSGEQLEWFRNWINSNRVEIEQNRD